MLHPLPILQLERHPPAAHCCLKAGHHLRLLQRVDEDACKQRRAPRQIPARNSP